MSEPHERLDRAMEDRRLVLRSSWAQVARDADISPQALRAIRRGEYRPSRLTARDLDHALRWLPGSVEAILEGGKPTPQGQVVQVETAVETDTALPVTAKKSHPDQRSPRRADEEISDSPVEAQIWRDIRERLEANPRLARLVLEILKYGHQPPEPEERAGPGKGEDRRRDAG